jgi:predicted permease
MRMLPLAHPQQLADVKIADNEHCCNGNFSARYSNLTYPQWEQIRDRQQAFSSLFAWGDHRFDLTQGGEVRFAEGLWVTGDFFRTLGVQPAVGRLVTGEDDRAGCGSPGVVLSYPFWQREYAGNVNAIGKLVRLDGHRLPIVGVTPAWFFGVEVGRSFDVIVPACAEPLIDGEDAHMAKRRDWWLAVIGRLKPGWTIARATAQLNAISPGVFENTIPPNTRTDQIKYYKEYKLTAQAAGSGVSSLRRRYEEPLLLLLGIAGLVLLIACANLANLMLARATAREREMAVRLAIGAGRVRLIRQLLSESLLLALVGAAAGVFVAQFLSRYLVSFLATGDNPVFLDLQADWRVLGFTAAAGILTCILFGLTPALRATRTSPAAAMKASGRGLTSDRERFGLRRVLVISQVGLSLVLLIGALLFAGSLRNLVTLDAGFRSDGLLIAGIDISRLGYAPARRGVLFRDLLSKVRSTPGVADAAMANIVQVSGDGWNEETQIIGVKVPGRQVPWFDGVTPGYFRTMGTPILAGRDIDEHDTVASPPVAVVNQQFSKQYLGGANPIGKQVKVLVGPGEPEQVYQIVGLVKSSKYQSLREDFPPIVYVAAAQSKEPHDGINIIVRSSAPLGELRAAFKRTVMSESPGISVQFQSFQTQLSDSLLRERLMASLSSFFGVLAALLAAVGLYGVLSYMVARRRNEIGIRMALGANRGNVVNLVVREAGILVLAGLVIGSGLALLAARTASSLLYGLKPNDAPTILVAALLLAAVALIASFLPALRASRLQPMTALRDE